jgi:hypothetical protein
MQRFLDGQNGFDNDVLRLCAAAYGFEVRQNAKDSSHASRISQEKAHLPRGIYGLLLIFLLRLLQEIIDWIANNLGKDFEASGQNSTTLP